MSYPDSIRFGYGMTLSGVVTKTQSWDDIVRVFLKPHRVYADKTASTCSPNILGGATDNRGKEDANILSRSLITLDYDDLSDDVTTDDFEFALDMLGYAALSYTTFSHMTDRAEGRVRLRVIVPLEDEIETGSYSAAARLLSDEISEWVDAKAGKESYTVAQVMFLPSCMEGYEQHAWSKAFEGVPFPLDKIPTSYAPDEDDAFADDLVLEIAYDPLDVLDIEVDKALELYPAEGLDYDEWIGVGLSLWHQYRGGDEGFAKWLEWSEKSPKHDPKGMRKKWKSGGGRSNPLTMASVFAKVGGLKAIQDQLESEGVNLDDQVQIEAPNRKDTLERVSALCEKAGDIDDIQSYDALKQVMLRIPIVKLGPDYRGMVADEIYTSWGKGAGLTKADIKKAITPDKKGVTITRPAGDGQVLTEADCWDDKKPEWLRGWVFDETDAEFVQVDTGHAIKRESFRMKYDREAECEAYETDAVTLSSKYYPIPTVSSRMYWPGNGRIFQDHTGGKNYLNTWQQGGGSAVVPAEPGSFDIGDDSMNGQACAVFLEHLERTIPDKRERNLVMDWLAFVYSKPGARVRWVLLLWGIEGNGKSYFHSVLSDLMGHDARLVTSSLIEERFTDWAEGCRVIGIEEIRVSGTNKWRTLDKMKPFISNDEIQVEGKGEKARTVPNFASYIMFTNHADAIPIDDGDRRYFVVFTKHRMKEELYDEHGGPEGVKSYFQRLFDVSREGASGIARLLLDHEYSEEFDPHGRAPDSIGKEEMRLMHISEEDDALSDALAKFDGPYINDKIIDVTMLQDECDMDGVIELPKGPAISHKLVGLGYSKAGRVWARKKNRTVWYRPSRISKTEAVAAIRQGGIDKFDPDIPF